MTADAWTGPAWPGIVFRRLRGPEDYAAIVEVINASEAADLIEETHSMEDLALELAYTPGLDPQADLLLAEADAGRLVGYANVWTATASSGERLYRHRGFVHPAWRQRGLGQALWRWAEARLRVIAQGHPSDGAPRFLQMVAEDTAPGKRALAEAHGYRPARYFFFMQRPTLDDLPDAPLPAGLEFRLAQPEHLRAIWDVKEAAFAEHWGHTAKTEADFRHWESQPRHDLGLWVVAWEAAAGRIVGLSLNDINPGDNARYGFRRGWVNSLGVAPAWRGRGLGRALLVESLRRLREAGMDEAVLGVDADNPSGALRLYTGVGFKVLNQDAVYRKPLK